MEELRKSIKELGKKFPKKHGEWWRLHIYNDNYLVYDTWNSQVYHHKGAESSGTDNLYRVVYVFSGMIGGVEESMINFWNAHIKLCINPIKTEKE